MKIAFIGRLEKDTGILIYTKVIELLEKKRGSIEFNIYGDGSLKNNISTGNYKGVTKDVDSVIQSHDIIFVSSYLSILDSINHQKLVVSVYDNPLKKDYLSMAPFKDWIIIGETPEEILEKLERVLSNKTQMDEMIKQGKKWVDTQSWEYLTNQYLALWKK